MEARKLVSALCACLPFLLGASYRTQNFIVNAPSAQVAKAVGDAAEQYRDDLAVEWLGKTLPPWSRPCPITVQVGPKMGAGGATSFVFDRGEVFGWTMNIQGSYERILDSVLPHEVTHTIFASHFRQPVPRWADEGACTTVEHVSERTKQHQMLIQFLKTNRGIPFSAMFAMKEYPADVLPLYAQGHSLAGFFIGQGGKAKFLEFVADGMKDEDWTRAVHQHYGVADLGQLQNIWLEWVRNGSRPFAPAGDSPIMLAAATAPAPAGVAQPNLPTPQSVELASANAGATPAAPLFQWTSAGEAAKKRARPTPNLVHHAAAPVASEANVIPPRPAAPPADPAANGASSRLVPVDLSAANDPTPGAPPVDPFAASAMSSGVRSAPIVASASRPQPPEMPGQIVLEWTKTSDAPVVNYSSAPQLPVTPLESASTNGVIRR